MQSSRSFIISRLRSSLSRTPLYRPLRFLYNRFFLLRANRIVQVNGLSARFFTPTFKIVDDLEVLAERDLLCSFLNAIEEGDSVWDVGANIGLYALFAARTVGHGGHVVAFEPEPKTRALLRRNIRLNGADNVTVLDCALDEEDGRADLYASATPNTGSHSMVQRTDYAVKRKGLTVPTVRGDSLVQTGKVTAPNLLKIDVEGAELRVLRGMNSLLRSASLRAILVEVHPSVLPLFGNHPDDVEALLSSSGWAVIMRVNRGGEFHLFAARQ